MEHHTHGNKTGLYLETVSRSPEDMILPVGLEIQGGTRVPASGCFIVVARRVGIIGLCTGSFISIKYPESP